MKIKPLQLNSLFIKLNIVVNPLITSKLVWAKGQAPLNPKNQRFLRKEKTKTDAKISRKKHHYFKVFF